jgi:hypothetical protein
MCRGIVAGDDVAETGDFDLVVASRGWIRVEWLGHRWV